MLTTEAARILAELERLGEVPSDHFKGRGGTHVPSLIRRSFAEWIRANSGRAKATSLKITDAGRYEVASWRISTDTGSVT